MSLLAVVLAAAGCSTLSPPAPQPAPVSLPGACQPSAIDGSGTVVFACGGVESEWSVDGARLGSSQHGASVVLPGRARGFWALGFGASGTRFLSIDRDGTLLGSLPFPPLSGDVLQPPVLLPDPRGGALLLQVLAQPGASSAVTAERWERPWQLVLERVTEAMGVVDGPHAIETGPAQAPELHGSVSNDGSFVLTADGWHFPPLRNNQLAARWFDPGGAPLSSWFAALDQATFGHPTAVLGDGSVIVEARFRGARLAPTPTPLPQWLPQADEAGWPRIFGLPDRIAIARIAASGCGAELEVRSLSGERCGTLPVPWASTSAGFCAGGTVLVGADGSLVAGSYAQPGAQVWPRLLAPR